MRIWSHTIAKNEERYIWYALRSVVEHVDKMLVWDTGSDDNTVKIIKEFRKEYPNKVDFKQVGEVDKDTYTQKRQEMLEETKSDWFMILDADEVWWQGSLKKTTNCIRKRCKKIESIVTSYYNIVGDIFHYQPESAGRYQIDDRSGHLTIRFMNRRIPGLYTARPHGTHGYFDQNDKLIQDRSSKGRVFLNAPFMHFTHMIRSSDLAKDKKVIKRDIKYKIELGNSFKSDFFYPEVFFYKRPKIVPSPWGTMSDDYFAKAAMISLPREIKRKLWNGKSGY